MGPIRVRMGLHGLPRSATTTTSVRRSIRVAQVYRDSAHGQQTLLNQVTYELVKSDLADDVTLSDLGIHRLKDLASPEHVWQLTHPSLPQKFSPLKSLDNPFQQTFRSRSPLLLVERKGRWLRSRSLLSEDPLADPDGKWRSRQDASVVAGSGGGPGAVC